MISIGMENPTTQDGSVSTLVNNRGGKRVGAGRKPVTDKCVTASIAMRAAQWQKLDSLRGDLSRSAWIRSVIDDQPETNG
jgi:hypothetical protein